MSTLLSAVFSCLCGGNGFMSTRLVKRIAKVGDLIEIYRGPYSHYTIYTGSGKVINIGGEKLSISTTALTEVSLDEVANGSSVRIRNHKSFALKFGKKAKHHQQVLADARKQLNNEIPYELLFRNCEYYCTLLKYGVGFSTQVIISKPETGQERYVKLAEHLSNGECKQDHLCSCDIETITNILAIEDIFEIL